MAAEHTAGRLHGCQCMPPSILMPGWSSLQTGRCHKLSLCLPTQGSTAECGRDIKPQIRPKISVCVLLALLHMSAKFGAIRTLRCAAPTSANGPLTQVFFAEDVRNETPKWGLSYGTPLDSMMALQDYYMATMFWAKMSNLSSKRSFYELRLTQYKRLDGNNGRRDMRRELQVTLQSYYRLPRHLS